MDRAALEALRREALVARAEAAGVRRARILTRPELVDELLRIEAGGDPTQLARARGFFGRARDLLARVIERGLHLPDAAERIRQRGTLPPAAPRVEPQALPTVTLAEIYAAQGHKQRAIDTLRRVLEREPDHVAARSLLDRLEDTAYVAPPPPLPPEPDVEPPLPPEPEVELPLAEPDEPPPPAFADGRAPLGESAPARDACFALPLAEGSLFVWWRVAEAEAPLVVRLVILEPSWRGPSRAVRDLPVGAAGTELVIDGIPPRAIVRVAIGTGVGEAFLPLVHSPAIERADTASGLAEWTRKGLVPVVLEDTTRSELASVLRRAERQGLAT